MMGCRSLCSSETPLWFLALYSKGVVSSQCSGECSFCHLPSTFDNSKGSCLTEASNGQIPAQGSRHGEGSSADLDLELASRPLFGLYDWKFHSVLPWHCGKPLLSRRLWEAVICALGSEPKMYLLLGPETRSSHRARVLLKEHVCTDLISFVKSYLKTH